MGQRLDLQALLLEICPTVYFQPPENLEMDFPCILYSRDWALTNFADDYPYRHTKRYSVTVIDRVADSPYLALVAALPMCIYDRHYKVKDLNHDVYKLFF